jgi:hypothetical protein
MSLPMTSVHENAETLGKKSTKYIDPNIDE